MMMHRQAGALAMIALLFANLAFPARASVPPPGCQPEGAEAWNTEVAVSLRELQRELEQCGSNCPQATRGLHGLGRVDGFVLDPAGDVVIFGPAIATGQPTQHTDELIIGLRAAGLRYAERKGSRLVYAPPGLTLNPRPQTIQALQQLKDGGQETWLDRYCEICRDPQDLVVLGIPFDSTAAQKMAVADWTMKKIANSDMPIPIEGYESLAHKRRRAVEEALRADRPLPAASFNRFWFHAALVSYVVQSGEVAFALDRADIAIRQQAQASTRSGETRDVDRADPLAAEWACQTSRQFRQVARKVPESGFDALAKLMRIFAVAKLIVEKRAFERAGVDPAWLLDRQPLAPVAVKREWPGIAHVERVEHVSKNGRTTTTSVVNMPSCGGVDADLDKDNLKVSSRVDGRIDRQSHRVLLARPAVNAVAWKVNRP